MSTPAPFIINTRQKTETFTISTALLGAGASVNSNILRCKGYGAVCVIATASAAGTLRILEGSTTGTLNQTNSEATGVDPETGNQFVAVVLPVHGEFMRIRFTNDAGVAQTVFQIIAYLLPEGALPDAGGGGGGGGGGMSLGLITRTNGQQNLATGALSLTTAVTVGWKPRWVALTFSAALSGSNQTLKIEIDSELGASYDALIEKITLAPAATAEDQSYFFAFPPELALRAGAEIRVSLTNTGTPASTVSAQIVGERCGECGDNG